jgi:hypothetical protein
MSSQRLSTQENTKNTALSQESTCSSLFSSPSIISTVCKNCQENYWNIDSECQSLCEKCKADGLSLRSQRFYQEYFRVRSSPIKLDYQSVNVLKTIDLEKSSCLS